MISIDTINAAYHSIKVSNGTYDLAIDSNGYLTIANSSFAVTASQLDIDDLSSANDNVEIRTAAGQALAIDGSGYLTITNSAFSVNNAGGASAVNIQDGGNTITVDGTVAATQSGTWTIGSVPAGYSNWQVDKVSVTTGATQIAASPLTGRLMVTIQNRGSVPCYLDAASGDVSADSFELPARSSVEWMLDDGAQIWGITASSTADIRIASFAA